MYKRFVTLLWLCWFVFPSSLLASESVRDPGKYFFQESFGDFSEELELAKEEGKKGILLFFEMDECPFCHFMKTHVLNRQKVQEYYRKHFKIYKVDIEGDIEITDFQGNPTTQKMFSTRQFRVRATPVIAFIDLEGKQIHRYTGRTSGPEEFLWMGEFVEDGHYKEQRFTKFKRNKRKAQN